MRPLPFDIEDPELALGDEEADPTALGLDPMAAESDILDEIMEYAQGRDAEGVAKRFAPAPADKPPADPEDPIPGVEPDGDEGELDVSLTAEGELSPEDLEALLGGG